MKKVTLFIALVALCFMCTPVFAVLDNIDDHSNTNQQGQAQGIVGSGNSSSTSSAVAGNNGQQQGQIGINTNENDLSNRNSNVGINDNKNTNVNDLSNRNTNIGENEQDQKQAQAMGQGQVAVGKVTVEDNSEYKSYAFSPPSIGAQKGTETGNIYSIFGGVGLSQTEEYQVAIEKLAVIERMKGLDFMTDEEAYTEARKAYEQLSSATQPKRWLGLFGKTRGRHLLNVFGLLAWDSFYKEGQKPFSSSEPKVVKEKAEIVEDTLDTYSGNLGNVNQ